MEKPKERNQERLPALTLQTNYGNTDSLETMLECMARAFYHLSNYEAGLHDCDFDVQRSFLEQLLRLRTLLDDRFVDNLLRNAFEDAVKRYFKSRRGHDDDSLVEAIKHMADALDVSTAEFGNRMMRLAIYYPVILTDPTLISIWKNNTQIKPLLIRYVEQLGLRKNAQEDILSVLRIYRNQLTESLNSCEFVTNRTMHNLEERESMLTKVVERLRDKNQYPYFILSELDRSYIDRFINLLDNTLRVAGPKHFVRLCECKKQCFDILDDLNRKPGSFSIEYLQKIMLALSLHIDSMYEKMYDIVQPKLSVEAFFVQCSSDNTKDMSVYLRFYCISGESALSNLRVQVLETENVFGSPTQASCAYVGKEMENAEYDFIDLRLKSISEYTTEVEFDAEFTYTVEMTGEEQHSRATIHAPIVDMKLDMDYEQMYNPGSALEVGNTITKYTFCGRDKLINKICNNFYDFPNAILVLYGQRRVGKTTIANHVAAKIQDSGKNFLVVKCGNSNLKVLSGHGDITAKALQDFYKTVLQSLVSTIRKDQTRSICLKKELDSISETIGSVSGISTVVVTDLVFNNLISKMKRIHAQMASTFQLSMTKSAEEKLRYYCGNNPQRLAFIFTALADLKSDLSEAEWFGLSTEDIFHNAYHQERKRMENHLVRIVQIVEEFDGMDALREAIFDPPSHTYNQSRKHLFDTLILSSEINSDGNVSVVSIPALKELVVTSATDQRDRSNIGRGAVAGKPIGASSSVTIIPPNRPRNCLRKSSLCCKISCNRMKQKRKRQSNSLKICRKSSTKSKRQKPKTGGK